MIRPWEEIINTSIIGTEKKQVAKQLLPGELATLAGQIESGEGEKEDHFLKIASLVYNYRRAGTLTVKENISSISVCENESLSYCNSKATSSLNAVLGDENNSLLFYWLFHCNKSNLIVQPEFIPQLFEIAEKNKELRTLIAVCSGKRGQWLSGFNPAWNFSSGDTEENIFMHGKPDERKEAFIKWRRNTPAEARDALEKVWKEEQAAVKAELLLLLENNLSKHDEAFLTEALKEKSQKVKEAALKLLKQIPDSVILTDVWNFVKPLLSYKKTATLLGLLSKETIEISLNFEIPEHFKSYGISHIDANKIYSEKEFTLSQMIAMIPPQNWEGHFNMEPAQIIDLFEKKEESKKFISSFAQSANTFKNLNWAIPLYEKRHAVCLDVVKDFSAPLREKVILENINENVKNILHLLPGNEEEWSLKFTLALIEKTSQEPYTYTKNYYKTIIHHFPVSLIDRLDSVTVTDEFKKAYWSTISEEIKKMLSIKQQIIQSF